MTSLIMTFHITIDRNAVSEVRTAGRMAKIIPFAGFVDSEHFKGKVLPGAADVQTTDAAGIRHMCAKYMFEGTDAEGRKCRLFVENNGYFEPGSRPKPFHACPTFMSDSPYLSDLLSRPVYRAEGHSTEAGVDIMIFDVTKENHEEAKEETAPVDPYIEELKSRQIPEIYTDEAKRIFAHEHITKMIYFSEHESKTYVLENPDEETVAAILCTLWGTMQMAFMINDKNELAAAAWIAGRIRNIENEALTVFAEIFKETGGDRYFDRPVNRYQRWRINEIKG